MDAPMESAWRSQQAAAARFTEVWRELFETAAAGIGGPQASRGVEQQLQALTRSAVDYAAVALGPLRDLVENQREFADQMTRWADLQRDFAENMASWAERQREYADGLERLMAPFGTRP